MATEIGAIKARLELDIRQYREGIERAKKDLADVSDGAKKASGNFGGLADAAEKVAEKQAQIGRLVTVLDNLNARIEAQRKKLAELKRSYESAFDDTRKSRLQEQIVNTEASLLRLTKASDDTAKKIWELEDSLDGASEKFDIFGESAKSSVTKLGIAYGALTAAMTAVITKSVETAAAFEQSMAKVRAVSGATVSEFQRLQDQAIELGATTVFTASQAADAQSYLAMAGFKANEIMAAMPGVLNLAAAGQMDLARTADIASNILTGFQLSANEAGRVVDVMAKAMSRSNTNIEQLGYAMKYAAPIAASTGVSIEETAAAIGKLSDAGIQGEMAGTQLRAILLRLIKPVGDAKDVMDQLGIKTQDAAGNILPFTSILRQVETAFAGLTQSAQAEAAALIAGTEAASGFLTLVNTGADSIESFASELRNAGGTAEQIAETQMDTLNGAIDEMKSALEGVGITVGNDFKPAIRAAAEEVTRMLLGINEMDAGARAFLITLPLVSAGLGTLATAIYGIVVALRALQSAGIAANAALGWISALSLVVGGVAAAFVSYKASVEEAAEAQRQFNELIEKPALERTADDVRALQAEMDELNRLLEQRAELERKLSEIPMAARASQEMAQEIRNLEQALDDTDKALKRFGIDTPEKAPEVLARLNDEINESIPALAELERQEMATVAAKVKHIDRVVELRRQYDELTKAEKLTEAQKSQLASVVEELTREYPSLIAQLDEENVWHIKTGKRLTN
ncbi:hypothetical protein PACILC2_22870 [Paenibacillus cisolokensis]|uniref:Phage tail tape measure protein domain-containing protein n=1 Tax=Paenibacillus cisolokensis TaxID=1658519 RepID=A0ABQ4N6D2_9BACL|nr:phage tail tape measure protein [Paenibacillus cisolokensis]GIQ63719.1 hypothetical protein PACILC2_22870 [Paenibacillus cisolokensis]